ncbi:hypothetical protein F4Z99_09575 [Candidatus Poribacteria bacterium]|nr:hypothetical protein [Candidatus Poribacteria bacterium]
MRKQTRQTFESLCVELDATLIFYRVRMAHKQGLADSTIAKRFDLPIGKVRDYIEGNYRVAKPPSLPKRLCPESSALWGVPILRTSCSETRLKRNSRFHRDSWF